MVGIYIRANNDEDMKIQEIRLLDYCNSNNLNKRIIYKDLGFSGRKLNRPALNKMIKDIETKRLDTIIVINPSKLYRDALILLEFQEKCNNLGVKIIFLDKSIINNKINENILNSIKEYVRNLEETSDNEEEEIE